jgi:hypothetical protein
MERERTLRKSCKIRTLTTDQGRQGKSAAFGPAHVVDGVEGLRGDESGHAVAAPRNLRQINAPRAVGLRKLAVRYHE